MEAIELQSISGDLSTLSPDSRKYWSDVRVCSLVENTLMVDASQFANRSAAAALISAIVAGDSQPGSTRKPSRSNCASWAALSPGVAVTEIASLMFVVGWDVGCCKVGRIAGPYRICVNVCVGMSVSVCLRLVPFKLVPVAHCGTKKKKNC